MGIIIICGDVNSFFYLFLTAFLDYRPSPLSPVIGAAAAQCTMWLNFLSKLNSIRDIHVFMINIATGSD
ncbi:MAG: hypothetical protein JXJ04_22465 [Spirochaetales bacterium]|nr:hypothetical protein [Spirochaetales bacterium]